MLLKVLEQASQATFDLELDDDTTIGTVKLLVEMDSDVPAAEMFLSLSDGSLLDNDEFTLAAYSINDNTQLLMARGHPPQLPAATSSSGGVMNVDWNAIMRGMTQASRQPQGRPTAIPPAAIAQFRERVFNNPYEMSHYRLNSPELASAIESNDTKTLGDILLKSQQAQYDRDSERRELEMKAMQDPMNVDVQRRIEELIQAENVEQSRQQAMEHMPESFASVVMLYINVVVNGYPIKAFVDSGAQMTIMSQACAERCGIARLVDKRYHGMAVGVGSQRILGRVHMYEIEVAGAHLPTSFSILEQQPMDMLLGKGSTPGSSGSLTKSLPVPHACLLRVP
jgi:DNA damage-inducible protein 1